MRIVTWNIARNRGGTEADAQRVVDALRSLEPKPDVVLLQEVFLDDAFVKPLLAALREDLGLYGDIRRPRAAGPEIKSYGCVVAARWPVELIDLAEPDVAGGEQWAHLVTAARVEHSPPFTAVSAHMPNGSGNGWAKIDAFLYLGDILRRSADAAVVVGGDFNEPRRFTAEGLESFGFTADHPERTWRRDGRGQTRTTGTHAEWQKPVEAVLGPLGINGIRRVADADGLGVVTHVVAQGTGDRSRCFDHILVSRHFRQPVMGVNNTVRRCRARRCPAQRPLHGLGRRRTDVIADAARGVVAGAVFPWCQVGWYNEPCCSPRHRYPKWLLSPPLSNALSTTTISSAYVCASRRSSTPSMSP